MSIEVKPIISFLSPVDEPSVIKEYEGLLPKDLSKKGQAHWIAARNLANDLAESIQLDYPFDRHSYADFYIHSYLLREDVAKRISGDKHGSYSYMERSRDQTIIDNHEEKILDDFARKLIGDNPEFIEAVKLNAQQIAHCLITQTHQTPHDELATRKTITSAYNALITYLYPPGYQVNMQTV